MWGYSIVADNGWRDREFGRECRATTCCFFKGAARRAARARKLVFRL